MVCGGITGKTLRELVARPQLASAMLLAHIAENRNKVANGAREHKQVPNSVGMFEFIVMIKRVKNDAQGVGDSTCG